MSKPQQTVINIPYLKINEFVGLQRNDLNINNVKKHKSFDLKEKSRT